MSKDTTLPDALEALAKSQLLTVDVLRQTLATNREMASTLGRIHDQNGEILTQLEAMGARTLKVERKQADSESSIRALQDARIDHDRRLTAAEKAIEELQDAQSAAE